MNNINSISPDIRDILLTYNIGKYNQVTQPLIEPIGSVTSIDYSDYLRESYNPNGLLDFTSKLSSRNKKGELEENVTPYNLSDRTEEILEIYDESTYKNLFNVNNEYKGPNNIISNSVDYLIGTLSGDSTSITANNEIISSSLKTDTSLLGRIADVTLGLDSEIGKVGLKNLARTYGNSILQNATNLVNLNSFVSKTKKEFENLDETIVNSLSSISSKYGNFKELLPIYAYSNITNNSFNLDYSWVNNDSDSINNTATDITDSDGNTTKAGELIRINKDGFVTSETLLNLNVDKSSLLYKTRNMFKTGLIQTMITQVAHKDDDGKVNIGGSNYVTKGRGLVTKDGKNVCRSWTANNQYNKIKNLIRPFSDENLLKLKTDLDRVRPNNSNTSSLDKYGVLQKDGFVKMSPYKDDVFSKNSIKNYMFSIENLAWKDSVDSLIEGTSQEGPNGGRIMWFPPYDISFNENTNVSINSDTFIGRGEPVYTYVNSERTGNLSFKLIVDHPSILNYYKQSGVDKDGNVITEDDYLRFMSGCDVLELPDLKIPETTTTTTPDTSEAIKSKTIRFRVYFPNNYSGVDDNNPILYLFSGKDLSDTDGNGYEIETGEWMGLNTESSSEKMGNFYYKVDSAYKNQTLSASSYYKDNYSYGLNSSTNSNDANSNPYSFEEIYNSLIDKSNSGTSEEQLAKDATKDYITQFISYTEKRIQKTVDEYNYNYLNNLHTDATAITEAYTTYSQSLSDFNAQEIVYNTAKNTFYKYNPSGFKSTNELFYDNSNINLLTNVDSNFTDLIELYQEYINKISEMNIFLSKYEEQYQVNLKTDYIEIYNWLVSISDSLQSAVDSYSGVSSSNTNNETNEIYNIISEASEIIITGNASSSGKVKDNNTLATNRVKTIANWLKKYNSSANYTYQPTTYTTAKTNGDDPNLEKEKLARFSLVIIKTGTSSTSVKEDVEKSTDVTTNGTSTSVETTTTHKRDKKAMYGYYYDSKYQDKYKTYNDEAMFFEQIGKNGDGSDKIIFNELSKKIKYFHPAFHSTTPEGFNSRLTFLQQCTRQGPTSEFTSTNNTSNTTATNLAFGRPPICVLRVGDFYNTKIIIDTLNINYEPLVWDLNQEGIGVQPMIAQIQIGFKFIGGSDLTGPIARLQNAVSFNFFANTGVYDDRNDRIKDAETDTPSYDYLYNPGVYDDKKTLNI